MTGLARLLLKAAVMWVGVAVGATPKWQSQVARLVISARRMALLATYLGMNSGERVARFGMIELS
jgi:hypothetical protein